MYNEGEIIGLSDLVDPTSGKLFHILKKVELLMLQKTNTEILEESNLVPIALLNVFLRNFLWNFGVYCVR